MVQRFKRCGFSYRARLRGLGLGVVFAAKKFCNALRREIREELGCDLQVGRLLLRHSHRYPDLEVELAFYECVLPEGEEPRALGVAGMEWAREGTLVGRPFCEADVPVLAELERSRESQGPPGLNVPGRR